MRLSFLFPPALALLLLLIPLWALAVATPRRRAPAGRWACLLLRTALIAALVFALAGARIVRDTDDLTTVFLLDRSDSIAPAERARADASVRDAFAAMRPGDRAALVAFGANAVVEQAVTSQPSGDLPVPPSAVGTNIQEAVELGLALLPAETNKRLVLLSDGGENAGDARTAARLAAARGVPLSYVDLGPPPGAGEALVSELHAPASVRAGQSFELVATVESSVAQAAHLRILDDGQPVAEQDVQLQPGLNRFPVKVDARGDGCQHYRAQIAPQQDLRGENSAAEAQVRVNGAPNVLMVIGRDGDGHELRVALNAAQVAVQPTSPDMLPNDLNQLSAYDAIVLVNVPRSALHAGTMEALQSYVRDLGKGLVMIGGDQTYGVGGYSQTPIEEALPVYMDTPNQVERPNLALVFVLAKSSSIRGCHCR